VAGETPYEAVRAFVEPIQEAISCFVAGKIEAERYDESRPGDDYLLTLDRARPKRLPGEARLSITITMKYRVITHDDPEKGPWKVSTSGWIYHLTGSRDEPLIQYHWHPDVNVGFPHLHYQDSGPHFPTGRVLIEDVLQAAVELGAEPRDTVRWGEVQERNRQMFERGATWGVGPAKPSHGDR
jgi:hypothetical protein